MNKQDVSKTRDEIAECLTRGGFPGGKEAATTMMLFMSEVSIFLTNKTTKERFHDRVDEIVGGYVMTSVVRIASAVASVKMPYSEDQLKSVAGPVDEELAKLLRGSQESGDAE